MDCREVQAQLIEYFYTEVSSEIEATFRRHLEQCIACAHAYRQLQESLQWLDRWKVTPPPTLWERIHALIQASTAGRVCCRGQETAVSPILTLRRLIVSTLVGCGATIGSILFLTWVLPSPLRLSTTTLLICGALWGIGYVILFGLALTRFTRGFSRLWSWIWAARVTLVALGVATVMIGLGLLLQRLGVGPWETILNRLLGNGDTWEGVFALSGVTALFSLFLGTLSMGPFLTVYPVPQVLLAGCFFTIAVAPGVTLLFPLSPGIYSSAMVGSSLGALLGGTLGQWILGQGSARGRRPSDPVVGGGHDRSPRAIN